ncbi:centrosomal protein of 78 kDa-like [Rhopilema esculentum]|uniref:centrosomal protein of 78 kDa-like n=1 Tax=Rhopilema esculentum TaxID=499914 RepID=UPI0031D47DB3
MDFKKGKQKKQENFKDNYEQLCAIQDSCPLATITANLQELLIDCNADRIRLSDWTPILKAIKSDDSLKSIAFRSFWQPNAYSQESTSQQRAYILRRRTPAVRSRDVTNKICRALKDFLTTSSCIECLVLQGIPLRERDLSILASGIMKSKSLQMISLESSQIGDAGLKALAPGLKSLLNLKYVCLSGCSLTWKGMDIISEIIQHQATKRHGEAWQESLRYRRPDLNGMLGLRRIDLCQNALIGDKGVQILANSLKDDLWIKALDLQRCGISSQGADAILSALDFNRSVRVLDVRLNPLLERAKIKAVLEKVMLNSGGEDPQYPWKSMNEVKETKRSRKPIRFTLNKSMIKAQTQRCRNRTIKPKKTAKSSDTGLSGSHVPWRTNARLEKNKYKIKSHVDVADHAAEYGEDSIFADVKRKSMKGNLDSESDDILFGDRWARDHVDAEEMRDLMIELKDIKRRYENELRQKVEVDLKLRELETENRKLKNEIKLLKGANKVLYMLMVFPLCCAVEI